MVACLFWKKDALREKPESRLEDIQKVFPTVRVPRGEQWGTHTDGASIPFTGSVLEPI
jgi:hypothetical protein